MDDLLNFLFIKMRKYATDDFTGQRFQVQPESCLPSSFIPFSRRSRNGQQARERIERYGLTKNDDCSDQINVNETYAIKQVQTCRNSLQNSVSTEGNKIQANAEEHMIRLREKKSVQVTFLDRVTAMCQAKRKSVSRGKRKNMKLRHCDYTNKKNEEQKNQIVEKRRKIELLKEEQLKAKRMAINNMEKIKRAEMKMHEQKKGAEIEIEMYKNILKRMSSLDNQGKHCVERGKDEKKDQDETSEGSSEKSGKNKYLNHENNYL